jgi:hypothetical protein
MPAAPEAFQERRDGLDLPRKDPLWQSEAGEAQFRSNTLDCTPQLRYVGDRPSAWSRLGQGVTYKLHGVVIEIRRYPTAEGKDVFGEWKDYKKRREME